MIYVQNGKRQKQNNTKYARSILFTHTLKPKLTHTHAQCTAAAVDLIPIVSCFPRGGGTGKLCHPGPHPGPGTLYYIDTYVLLLMLANALCVCVCVCICVRRACTYTSRLLLPALDLSGSFLQSRLTQIFRVCYFKGKSTEGHFYSFLLLFLIVE